MPRDGCLPGFAKHEEKVYTCICLSLLLGALQKPSESPKDSNTHMTKSKQITIRRHFIRFGDVFGYYLKHHWSELIARTRTFADSDTWNSKKRRKQVRKLARDDFSALPPSGRVGWLDAYTLAGADRCNHVRRVGYTDFAPSLRPPQRALQGGQRCAELSCRRRGSNA